jgi:hypothetical protein
MKKIKAKIVRTVTEIATITIDGSGDPVELLEVHEEIEDDGIEILDVREVIQEF